MARALTARSRNESRRSLSCLIACPFRGIATSCLSATALQPFEKGVFAMCRFSKEKSKGLSQRTLKARGPTTISDHRIDQIRFPVAQHKTAKDGRAVNEILTTL